MTALIVMLVLTLAAMAWLWLSFRRDAKRRVRRHAKHMCGSLIDAGYDDARRYVHLRNAGYTVSEIAQAEEDAE